MPAVFSFLVLIYYLVAWVSVVVGEVFTALRGILLWLTDSLVAARGLVAPPHVGS